MSQSMLGLVPAGSTVPTPFNFDTHAVRVVLRDGEPWFVASDVCIALGYRDAEKGTRHLGIHQKSSSSIRTPGGEQRVTIINESGLYRLVLRSRKPEAEKFSDWVTGEVLPAIRKTGGYAKPTTDPERIKLAFSLAAQAAAEVERAVFDAVIAGDDDWRGIDRWLLAFSHDHYHKTMLPYVKVLGHDQIIASVAELIQRVGEPGEFKTPELLALNSACAQKLAERLGSK